MHDKHMQTLDDWGAMNNTNAFSECLWAPSPLVWVVPPHRVVPSSKRSRVQKPEAASVKTGH